MTGCGSAAYRTFHETRWTRRTPLDTPCTVPVLLPVHRDRAWRARCGGTWSWDESRAMWLDESKGEADRDGWRGQKSMESFSRLVGPFTEVD